MCFPTTSARRLKSGSRNANFLQPASDFPASFHKVPESSVEKAALLRFRREISQTLVNIEQVRVDISDPAAVNEQRGSAGDVNRFAQRDGGVDMGFRFRLCSAGCDVGAFQSHSVDNGGELFVYVFRGD